MITPDLGAYSLGRFHGEVNKAFPDGPDVHVRGVLRPVRVRKDDRKKNRKANYLSAGGALLGTGATHATGNPEGYGGWLPMAGAAGGAGASARPGKRARAAANAGGRSALEGIGAGSVGAVPGALTHNQRAMTLGGRAGLAVGTAHGGWASANSSRKKGYLKPGY